MFEIVFISYDEENAEENWRKLQKVVPRAKRVHGVKGISCAHEKAASICHGDFFYTVDGDNQILESFDWNNIVEFEKHRDSIHVWRCRNSVNGLVYGYGGVKLWPKKFCEKSHISYIDYTTTAANGNYKVQNKLASETAFNTSPYSSWKSGFRECSKLSSDVIINSDDQTYKRLLVWLSTGIDSIYGDWAILGARMGALYGLINKKNIEKLSLINDFQFLLDEFKKISDINVLEEIEKLSAPLLSYGVSVSLLTKEESIKFKQKQLHE